MKIYIYINKSCENYKKVSYKNNDIESVTIMLINIYKQNSMKVKQIIEVHVQVLEYGWYNRQIEH